MNSEDKTKAALNRTDTALAQVVIAIGIGFALAYCVDWKLAAVIGLVLASVPLWRWFAAEFAVWNQGDPAGDAEPSSEDATPNA